MAQETCSSSSPSSSSSNQTWSYDVFVSFCGKDTRLRFTDHLFDALYRSGIHTFRDDRKLERGKAIQTELEKAIETSRISVIVFSINYVASSWCLDELEKIMECKRSLQQIVLPVFYDVDPSEVRAQKGRLAKVFAERKGRLEKDKVRRWRAALTQAASLSGWDLQNVAHRFESTLIKDIIEDISSKLNLPYFMVATYPVGIESRVQKLNELLRGSGDVCVVGIWGIGGIGKTTIAKAIYNQLQRKFEASCFLENVGEIAKQPNGLIDLQELILSSFHVNDNRKIKLVDQGTMVIKNRAWCKRVLVVLDDVDHRDQLDKLAIRRGYFRPGSIIIITTRDKSTLKLDEINEIYTPLALDYHESMQLLSWHAFGKDHPKEDYVKFSKEVIYYAGGLPLVLKVLGSFLSNKSTNEWEGALEKLRVIPQDEIQKKLMVSFHSLSDTQRELFLDIACFFVGMEKGYAFKILQDSNLFLESELGVLIRRCLVTIDCSNRLTMHDMIIDMGREVVRKESPKVPGERSRLWFHEDVLDVLKYHTGTKSVEGIMLYLPEVHDLQVESKAFAKMHQLRVLQLNYTRLKGNFQCPSKRLRYLEWYGFPMESIPPYFYMENLVAIYMPYSSLIELWTGTKILKKLKFLDVSHSYYLRGTPDFSEINNLEVLVLNNCTSLVEIHKSVICLDKLVTFDLADCKSLKNLPQEIDQFMSRVTRLQFKSPPRITHVDRHLTHIEKVHQHMAKPRHFHPPYPQPYLKERATLAEIYINVLNNFQNTPTFKSELDDYKKMKKEREVMRVEWIPSCFAHGKLVELWTTKIGQKLYFTVSHSYLQKRENDLFSRFIHLEAENLINRERLLEMTPEVIEFKAGHGLITETPFPRVEFSPGVLVEDLACQRSFPRPFILSTASIAQFHSSVIINFIDRLGFGINQCRTLLNQLSKGLEAMDAKIAKYLEWICSGYFKPDVNSNPRKKLFKEMIATFSISVFLSWGEFSEWFHYKSTGSILSFVAPPATKQKIRGWLLCGVFATRFHDIHESNIICEFKNNTKGIEWQHQQKKCRLKPSQEHMWLHSVPLHDIVHMLEAGDEVVYSIQVSGSFQLKKFGVRLIYENDTKGYRSNLEAMIQNAHLLYKYDFLDEEVSTDQVILAGDKIHPTYLQVNFYNHEPGMDQVISLKPRPVLRAVPELSSLSPVHRPHWPLGPVLTPLRPLGPPGLEPRRL